MSQDLFADALSRISGSEAVGTVTGTAGGGAVTVTMDGARTVQSVVIDPEAAEDVTMLAELVRAAVNDALGQATGRARQAAMDLLGQLTAEPAE